jgi:hypothetical protein
MLFHPHDAVGMHRRLHLPPGATLIRIRRVWDATRRGESVPALATIANDFDGNVAATVKRPLQITHQLSENTPAPPTWRFFYSNVGGLFDQLVS